MVTKIGAIQRNHLPCEIPHHYSQQRRRNKATQVSSYIIPFSPSLQDPGRWLNGTVPQTKVNHLVSIRSHWDLAVSRLPPLFPPVETWSFASVRRELGDVEETVKLAIADGTYGIKLDEWHSRSIGQRFEILKVIWRTTGWQMSQLNMGRKTSEKNAFGFHSWEAWFLSTTKLKVKARVGNQVASIQKWCCAKSLRRRLKKRIVAVVRTCNSV